MDIRMSDGLLVSFPEGMPISEIKEQTRKYEDKIKNQIDSEKELNDESIGVGESTLKKDRNKLTTIGTNVYKTYRYAPVAGWNGYSALANQIFANVPEKFIKIEDMKKSRQKNFDPKKEDSKFKGTMMAWYDFHKDQQELDEKQQVEAQKKAGSGFTSKVIEGIVQTPGVIALYTPLTVATGSPMTGFALTNMLAESEKREGETKLEYAKRVGFAGAEGALMGKFLSQVNQFRIPTRVTGMAAMGAAGPAENGEQRIANATTFGLLGIFGPKLANQSKLDLATESIINKTKSVIEQQKNIAKAERAVSDTQKSLTAIIDQHTFYEKQVSDLTIQNVKLEKQKNNAKSQESKNQIDQSITNNNSTIKSINAEKGKLKTAMDNLSAVLRDNQLFSTKFMRDFDMVSSLTPTEARVLLVKGVDAVVSKKRKNTETGKYETKEENTTQLRRNAKYMEKGKHESQFANLLDAMARGVRKYVVPAKFLGDYPVAKYGVDLVSRYNMEVSYMTKLFLENPQAFKTIGSRDKIKGFSPLKYTALNPSEGIGIIAFEKLPLNSQAKVVETMSTLDAEYTLYRKMSKEERLEDYRFDNKSGEATQGYMDSFKLTKAELNAVKDIQKSFDGLQKFYNQHVVNYGTNLSKINRRPNYFPRIYLGEYKVYVSNTKGDLLGVYGANTLKEANAVRKKLLAEGELQLESGVFLQPKDLKINIRSSNQSQVKDISAEVFQDVMNLVVRNKSNKKAIDALDKAVNQLYIQRGFNVQKIKRTGKQVAGYLGTYGSPKKRVEDFKKAVTTYISGGVQSALRIKLAKEFSQFYTTPIGKGKDGNFITGPRGQKTIADLYPEDFKFASMYKDNAVGLPINKIVETLRKSPEGVTVENMVSKFYGKSANYANIFFLLMLNPRFIMLQGIQPLQMLPHKLAGMTVETRGGTMADATAHAYYSTALGMMRTLKPTEFNIALTKSAVRQNVITEAMLREFMGDTYFSQGKLNAKFAGRKALNFVNGKIPVGFMEKFTRLQAVNIIGEHMLSLGYSKDFIIKQAPYIANQRMVEYHSYNRPMMFNMLGAISKPAGLFKTYAHNWYGQMIEAVQKADFQRLKIGKQKLPIPVPKGQTTQLTNFIASQAFFGGLKGVVGVTFVDFIMKLTGANTTLSDFLIKVGLPDIFLFGAPSTVLQADMSNSLMAPTTDPTEVINFPSFEFAINAVAGISELSRYYTLYKAGQQLTGKPFLDYTPPANSEVRDAWKKVTPTSLHGWIESWYQNHDNPYYIQSKTENIQREEKDWWARKYLAMRSLDEAKKMTFKYMLKRKMGKESMNRSDFIQMMAESYIKFNGNIEEAWEQWMYDYLYEKHGFKTPKEVHNSIKRMLNNMQSTFTEQMERGGITEQEQEIYEKSIELGIGGF